MRPDLPAPPPEEAAPGQACGMSPSDGPTVGLATLAARLAVEMDALADLAARLDARMGALVEDTSVLRDPRDGVQDLDRLRQMAADLALVQRRLADTVPGDLRLPVAALVSRLQVGALAHRLRTGTCPDGAEPCDDPGRVAFF